MSHVQHKAEAPQHVVCTVITCSDSRSAEEDDSGRLIIDLLTRGGHSVAHYVLVKDDALEIRTTIEQNLQNPQVHAIILTGGTGISPRDVTYETVGSLLEKRLDGFGEIFRFLSYHEIGSAAILSRAIAGVCRHKVIFALPGSKAAVRLAMEKLVLEEIGHIVGELHR